MLLVHSVFYFLLFILHWIVFLRYLLYLVNIINTFNCLFCRYCRGPLSGTHNSMFQLYPICLAKWFSMDLSEGLAISSRFKNVVKIVKGIYDACNHVAELCKLPSYIWVRSQQFFTLFVPACTHLFSRFRLSNWNMPTLKLTSMPKFAL